VSCGGRCRSPRPPPKIGEAEALTRFLFKGDFSQAAKTVKQRAFLPEVYKGVPETSVARLTHSSAERVAHLGRYIRHPLAALGKTDIKVASFGALDLSMAAAPQLCFGEHAVITGWPSGADPKAVWKQRAALMVQASSPVELL
jgi:hypothetical protein